MVPFLMCLLLPLMGSCDGIEATPMGGSAESAVRLDVDFDTPVLDWTSSGDSAGFEVRSVAAGDARLELVPDNAEGLAARFPSVDDLSEEARVVVLISDVDAGAGDRLSPGTAEFRFGADIMLDERSDLSGVDNGDNVVQRGLFADSTQFKLQVDHGVPSCRVAGDGGEVYVEGEPIPRDTWVSLECHRHRNQVTLTASGLGGSDSWTSTGETGALTFPRETPMSVGGKVTADLHPVVANSDQLNGALDNLYFEIVGP